VLLKLIPHVDIMASPHVPTELSMVTSNPSSCVSVERLEGGLELDDGVQFHDTLRELPICIPDVFEKGGPFPFKAP